MDKKKIKKEAKKIMDDFLESLKKVEESEESFEVKREKNVREVEKCEEDEGFRKRMLKNAPKTKDGCVQAEKKKW